MWNQPSRKRLNKIPLLYETEEQSPADKLIHLHFFIGGCDWFIAEFNGYDIFWGYAILNSDTQNAEWSYISFSELKAINLNGLEIDCQSEYWQPKPVALVPKIKILED